MYTPIKLLHPVNGISDFENIKLNVIHLVKETNGSNADEFNYLNRAFAFQQLISQCLTALKFSKSINYADSNNFELDATNFMYKTSIMLLSYSYALINFAHFNTTIPEDKIQLPLVVSTVVAQTLPKANRMLGDVDLIEKCEGIFDASITLMGNRFLGGFNIMTPKDYFNEFVTSDINSNIENFLKAEEERLLQLDTYRYLLNNEPIKQIQIDSNITPFPFKWGMTKNEIQTIMNGNFTNSSFNYATINFSLIHQPEDWHFDEFKLFFNQAGHLYKYKYLVGESIDCERSKAILFNKLGEPFKTEIEGSTTKYYWNNINENIVMLWSVYDNRDYGEGIDLVLELTVQSNSITE